MKACVKMSGSLLAEKGEEVFNYLKKLSSEYDLLIIVGGGEQINEAFRKRNFQIEFSPVGRICTNKKQKVLAKKILKNNKSQLTKELKKRGIKAKIILPLTRIGGNLCHVNGDLMILNAYVEYEKIFLLTKQEKVIEKKFWLSKLAKLMSSPQTEIPHLNKIEVVGF